MRYYTRVGGVEREYRFERRVAHASIRIRASRDQQRGAHRARIPNGPAERLRRGLPQERTSKRKRQQNQRRGSQQE